MEVSQQGCAVSQALVCAPVSADEERVPVQLTLPAVMPKVAREPRLPRWKRVEAPLLLMLGIDGGGGPARRDDGGEREALYTFDGVGYQPASEQAVVAGVDAVLSRRFRRGVTPILHYPGLVKRFLQVKIACQPRAAFFAFFMDRRGRLIQVAELFRGTTGRVKVYTKPVVAAALACEAEMVLFARTDSGGNSEPSRDDVDAAWELMRAFGLMEIGVVDYVVVGDGMTSLRKKGLLPDDGETEQVRRS